MSDAKRRDQMDMNRKMTAMKIANENKQQATYRQSQANQAKWADKMKEDDIMKEPINKYNNWIR